MFFKVRYVFRNIHETHPCGAFRGRQGRREKGADQCHERNRPPVTTCREAGARGARLRHRGAAFKNKDVRVSPGGWSPRTPLALEVSGDAPRKPPLPLRGPPLCLPRGSGPRGAVRKGPCPWPADPRMVPAMCCPPQLEGCIPHPTDAEGLAGWDPAGVQACVPFSYVSLVTGVTVFYLVILAKGLSFLFISKYFLIFLAIFSLTHWLIGSMLIPICPSAIDL